MGGQTWTPAAFTVHTRGCGGTTNGEAGGGDVLEIGSWQLVGGWVAGGWWQVGGRWVGGAGSATWPWPRSACLWCGVVRPQVAPIVPTMPTWGLRMVSVLSSLLGTRTNCFSGLANGCPWMPYLSPAPGVAWSQVGHVMVDGDDGQGQGTTGDMSHGGMQGQGQGPGPGQGPGRRTT
jgi:hypothetical protein